MTKSKSCKITISDSGAATHSVAINGRVFTMPTGSEIEVDDGVMDALRNSGAAFAISGEEDGPDNAVSVSRVDPPLSGGPKVVVGDFAEEGETNRFLAGNVDDDKELGDGLTSGTEISTNSAAGSEGRSDFTHDSGGQSAPNPGSRDTIATSAQPEEDAAPAKRSAGRPKKAK